MKILQLNITDLKRINAIEINPEDGKPIILTGDNGNGKSSVLDGIILALSNKGLEDPIRHGRPAASVKITLGQDKAEYLLERKVTKKGDYLTLTTAEGLPVQKAQTFLNGLMGNYAFDPLEFTRLKPKEQVEALKAAAGLDFTELDAKRAEFYNQRTIIGRDGKEAAAQLAAIPAPAEDAPEEEVSAAELVDKLRAMEKAADHLVVAKRQVKEAMEKEEAALREIDRLKELLKQAEAHHSTCAEMIDNMQAIQKAAEKEAPTQEQIDAAREAIAKVDETNRAVRNARAYRELDAKVKKMRADYATLDRRIEEIDEQKAQAVKDANLPIDGLELSDEGVLMNGNFFSQLSTAEQIRISALVAMSQNPNLKIIIIREGALMNQANLKMLSDLAAENDFQLWIERFQEEPGNTGLHIVDGSITHEDGKPITE